jgi:hypothetical protein
MLPRCNAAKQNAGRSNDPVVDSAKIVGLDIKAEER